MTAAERLETIRSQYRRLERNLQAVLALRDQLLALVQRTPARAGGGR